MKKEKTPKYFNIISLLFVVTLIISNIVATKLFNFGSFIFTGGVLIFPLTYIFGDILTEVYGYSRSRKIIWQGLFSLIFMSLIFWLVGLLPPASGWENQKAYLSVLGIVPRIVLASILGYLLGEFTNSIILAKIKILTKGRHLWIRTIGSTIFGEGVDTIIFVLIGFYGTISANILVIVAISTYLFKVLYEIIATPLTYLIVNQLKKAENLDVYDYKTNFNMFRLK